MDLLFWKCKYGLDFILQSQMEALPVKMNGRNLILFVLLVNAQKGTMLIAKLANTGT